MKVKNPAVTYSHQDTRNLRESLSLDMAAHHDQSKSVQLPALGHNANCRMTRILGNHGRPCASALASWSCSSHSFLAVHPQRLLFILVLA